jgi:hypothetical protein
MTQANKTSSGDAVPFDDAVREAKEILDRSKTQERKEQMRLGELADKVVHPKYGDRTLAKFAKAIGIASCTLARYQSVYRAWDGRGIQAPGPVSYAVLRELQDHPDRSEIVKKNPNLSKREAREFAQDHKGQAKKQKQKASDWQTAECERYFRKLMVLATDAIEAAEFTKSKHSRQAIRKAFEPKNLPVLRQGGEAFLKIIDYLAKVLAEEEELARAA